MKSKDEQINIIQNILGKGKKNYSKNVSKTKRHVWSIEEENIAFDLYKNKANLEEIENTVKNMDVSFNSMNMKIQNIQFLDIGIGLENCGETTRRIFDLRKNELMRLK